MSWDAGSKSEASSLALEFYRKQGGSNCKVQMWAWNSCVALATSPDGTGTTDWKITKEQAQTSALQACLGLKGKGCVIQQSACANDPLRDEQRSDTSANVMVGAGFCNPPQPSREAVRMNEREELENQAVIARKHGVSAWPISEPSSWKNPNKPFASLFQNR